MAASDRIDELKKRYDENPRRFFASLANEYRKSGDLETAISLCQMHLAEQPGNMNGHVVYGQALFEAGRYDEARVTFETALNLDPENLIALRHLGDIACTNGENNQAREWYRRVLDADPRNDEILALLANLEAESTRVAAGTPVAPIETVAPPTSDESAAERDSRTLEFTPPVAARASVTPVAGSTPVVPIESIPTIQTPARGTPSVPTPAPRGSMGLMDLAIDFEPTSEAPTEPPAEPKAADSAHDEFPAFEEISLGTPMSITPPAHEPAAELMDPFGEPSSIELQRWEPPVVQLEPVAPAPVEEPAPADAFAADEDLPLVTDFAPSAEHEPTAEIAPEAVEPAAPVEAPALSADSIDLLYGDALPAEPAAPFVTETMAELYLQQGFQNEALEVYRQLSAQAPGDERLRDRVHQLEGGDTTVAPEAAPPEHAYAPASVALTARSYFAGLAARRAVQGGGLTNGSAHMQTPYESTPALPGAEFDQGASAPPLDFSTSATTLDQLFAGGSITPQDEYLALAFAQVAGAVEMGSAAPKGKPTAPAATELSLDSVFKSVDSRGTGGVTRQSQTLRFDQFFATAGDGAAEQQAPEPSAPAGEPGSPAEIQQFQSWLSGLKKP